MHRGVVVLSSATPHLEIMAKKVVFELPEGFEVPEGIVEGETFETGATLRVEPNGKVCLIELDGFVMPGYDGEKTDTDATADESLPPRSGFEDRYASEMGA